MEIWVPYGSVESLLTLQAENLGELVDPAPEGHAEEISQVLKERIRGYERLIVCDSRPATLKLLRAASQQLVQDGAVKVLAISPKSLEDSIPELKGRVMKTSPPSVSVSSGQVMLAPELVQGRSMVLATGGPDPLFGYSDARVASVLSFGRGGNRLAYDSRESDEPAPLKETRPYSTMLGLLDGINENSYVTVVTRGGEPYSVIDGGAGDARGHFFPQQLSPTKGIVVGGGGKGYDDTFSGLLRSSVGLAGAVRKGGDILLVGECGDGIGSAALQMQAQGRISDASLRRGFYADGMEEIKYLSRLKEEYTVTLLSSLPDLYAGGRFRFRTGKSTVDALQKVFASAGRTAKLHVLTRAPETILT